MLVELLAGSESAGRSRLAIAKVSGLWLQFFAAVCVVCVLSGCVATPDETSGSRADSTTSWQPFEFPFKRATRYVPITLDGKPVIQADADSSVSLYRRVVRVEPNDLGHLAFSWMVPQLIEQADLSIQEREDAPVRLVLSFDGDLSKLPVKDRLLFDLVEGVIGEPPPYATLMYVWDNHAPVGSVIVAARTGRIRKIVVDSGPTQTSVWRFHDRDIASDFRKAYGEEPGTLTSVALMTDADNTRTKVRAFYGEVKLLGPSAR
jgi:Protein of unknown function (DUF3047)